MEPAIALIQEQLNRPPIAFDPAKQSLKAWVMYCLRDRGFKVGYAENADFAITLSGGGTLRFKVAELRAAERENLAATTPQGTKPHGWIVRDPETNQVQVIPPA